MLQSWISLLRRTHARLAFCLIWGSHHGRWKQWQHLLGAVIHPDFFRPASICCGALQERICTGGEGRRICGMAPAPSDAKVWRAKKQKQMTNGTLVIFWLVIYPAISTMQWRRPEARRPEWSSLPWDGKHREWERSSKAVVFTRLPCVPAPCQMLRSLRRLQRRRRCQPLGQPAARLSNVAPSD